MVEDTSAFFTDFAESVTVNGTSVQAIVDTSTQQQLGDVLSDSTSLLLPASSVPAAAEGQVCVVRSVNHRIRQVLQEPPDGVLVRLVLVKG